MQPHITSAALRREPNPPLHPRASTHDTNDTHDTHDTNDTNDTNTPTTRNARYTTERTAHAVQSQRIIILWVRPT